MRNININLMMLGKNILSAAVKMTFTELDKVAQKYEIELYYSQYHLTDHHEGEARGESVSVDSFRQNDSLVGCVYILNEGNSVYFAQWK